MKIWLDDIYSPDRFGCADYVWYKNGRTLFKELEEIEDKITHLHLDHYLTENVSAFDQLITGREICWTVIDGIEEGLYKNLKYIYIHTSCDDEAEKYYQYFDKKELKQKYGVLVTRSKIHG